ncbi:MAG: penicillin-binding protein activator [Massilia sp.]
MLKGLLAAATLVPLVACAAPCDAPGRLCAPIEANTSAPPAPSGQPAAREQPVAAQTYAIEMSAPASPSASTSPSALIPASGSAVAATSAPASASAKPSIHIALLLPLNSDTLGAPAAAVKAGFMAAYERDRDGIAVEVIDSGDQPQQALDAYAAALPANDLLVGPLARSAVSALAASKLVTKPTIVLNHPEARSGAGAAVLPAQMLAIGLSIEDEARQVANWAGADHPGASVLIVSSANAWQRRIAGAFGARWRQLGYPSQLLELPDSNGYLSEAALKQLKQRVDNETPSLLFAALDADQTRQLRAELGNAVPLFGASSVNPGRAPGSAIGELDGLQLLDMPWLIQADHNAVMVYPRYLGERVTLDMDRLYALGIDAFRVARELALRPGAAFQLDGVTGRLGVGFAGGKVQFERVLPAAIIESGNFSLVPRMR